MSLKSIAHTTRHAPAGVSRPAPAARPELPAVPRRFRVAAALASAFISLALMQTIASSLAPQAIGHAEVATTLVASPRG